MARERKTSSLRPKMSSSQGVFAERGDPWLTEKEQFKDFSRGFHQKIPRPKVEPVMPTTGGLSFFTRLPNDVGRIDPPDLSFILSETPDLDAFTKAHRIKERHDKGPDKPIRPALDEQDFSLRRHNILREMNAGVRPQKVIEVKPTPVRLALSANPERKMTGLVGYSVVLYFSENDFEERDRKTIEQARVLLEKKKKDGAVVKIEIWSYVTGELHSLWEQRP